MSSESCKVRKQGILRAEAGKSRRASAVSVEFKEVEPTSPQPSIDRLSVSFANDDKKVDSGSIIKTSITENDEEEHNDADEEDEYSASANVILERNRDSWKRRSSKRRGSSPFSPPPDAVRRRSSIFTISSGETSVDDVANQNMRIHKEVVTQIKYQPWPMRRKLRLVQQAKTYIKLHEGQIQERLAHNKSTRDMLAHMKIVFLNHWSYFGREVRNILNNMIPWECRIKEIESHFGSAVASYFTFHRWLFSVNLKISLTLLIFVILPEMFLATRNPEFSGERKCMLPHEVENSKKFLTLWNFEGALKHSVIFYGFYNARNSNSDSAIENKLPLIYFVTGLGMYIYSFVAILRKMAENSRQSKLTEKDEDCIFTWKLFTSWDFMIGNPETANNRVSSIILGFKEALLEEAEKTREEKRNWKLFSIRIFTHLNVLWLLGLSMYAVTNVVHRSLKKQSGWWHQNEVTIVITLIGMVYPVIFDVIGLLEKYHPRKALRLQLARIMVLNLLNLYSFIFATFLNIEKISEKSNCTKPNETMIANYKSRSSSSTKSVASPLIASLLVLSGFSEPPHLNLMHDPSEMILGDFSISPQNKSIPIFNNYDEVEYENTPQNIVYNGDYPDISGYTSDPRSTNLFSVSTNSVQDISSEYNGSTKYYNIYENETKEIDTTPTGETITDDYRGQLSTGYSSLKINEEGENSTVYSSFSSAAYDNIQNSTEIESTIVYSSSTENSITVTNEIYATGMTTIPGNKAESTVINETTYSTPMIISPEIPMESGNVWNKTSDLERNNMTSYSSQGNTTIEKSEESICYKVQVLPHQDISPYARFYNNTMRKKIHELCWETMFGQELVKLTVMDLFMTAASILMVDFFRALFVRYMNSCWCWDLEKTFPQYGDFKIAENILHLVNNQGMVWMGMFFSPGLPLINVLKLVILMYLRSWAVLTCNVPHEVVFRASRSNNFYFALLLTMLFLCVLPVGYALVRIDTSWHCGPFSMYSKIYYIFTTFLTSILPGSVRTALDYVASPGIIIPLLVLLILIIYYLVSLTNALREANDDLKIQLRRERTEERRKVFQMANKKKKGTGMSESPFNKWCTVMNTTLSAKASIDIHLPIVSNENSHPKSNKISNIKEPKENVGNMPENVMKSDSSERNTNTGKNHEGKNEKNSSNADVFRDREDSVISGWSVDNIPEIRISQSDSFDDSMKSHETVSQSKSSSKETIINIGPQEEVSESQDDVFEDIDKSEDETKNTHNEKSKIIVKKAEETNRISVNEGMEDTENEELLGIGESYESIPKSINEINSIGKRESPNFDDSAEESRKQFAKILVDGLKK